MSRFVKRLPASAATTTMRASAPTAVETTTTAASMEATTSVTVEAATYSTVIAATRISAAASISTAVAATAITVACAVSASIAITTAIAVTATEPRTGTDEDATVEVRRAIVPVGRAIIRGIIEIPIRAIRRGPNVYNNLRRCHMARGERHHPNSS